MRTSTALPEIDETVLATTRYLGALTQLDDESSGRPSVLPGWSRAHVVAHLSRNADALARVLAQAAAGAPASMYDSVEQRDADIEATVAGHDAAGLREDAIASAGRLTEALWAHDGDGSATYSRIAGTEAVLPLTGLAGTRRTEVEVHHADLDVGYSPTDWPVDFSLGLVRRRHDELSAQAEGCPSMVLSSTDVEGLWKLGVGRGPEIEGAVGDLAWWLVGRGGGQGLTCSSGQLPDLGRWR